VGDVDYLIVDMPGYRGHPDGPSPDVAQRRGARRDDPGQTAQKVAARRHHGRKSYLRIVGWSRHERLPLLSWRDLRALRHGVDAPRGEINAPLLASIPSSPPLPEARHGEPAA